MTAFVSEYGGYLDRVRDNALTEKPPMRRVRRTMGERARGLWTLAQESERETRENSRLGRSALSAAYNPVYYEEE